MANRFFSPVAPILVGALALSGCPKYFYKQKPSILPPYIQKIAIRPFANHTQQYGLEDKLTLAIQSEFNQDGRYQITTEEKADGVVIGDIFRYILEPLSYDASHIPTQYKLSILVNVAFYDKVKNKNLWREPSMTGELRYFTASSAAGSLTEVDAQQTIWDQLSRDIATRTFEGFGTVTQGSEKSGLKSGTELNSVPAADENRPPPMPAQEPSAPPSQLPY